MPQHWLIVPPPLYCITLSRIAEEALTNIIKHSQATQVTVKFEQDWQHNLILTIQDNGVGFDAEHVQPNLHVGLHSMQMRIQRLGGLLKIQSEDHYTQISAQLNTQRILDNGENV
jgi:two-component system, NarL family, sensor histidine kinase UhpB